jgi:undecaprenyl-diphosphatase
MSTPTFAKAVGLTQSHPFPVGVKLTEENVEIAQTIAHHTSPLPEEIAKALPLGADEKLLFVLAAIIAARYEASFRSNSS